MPATSHAFAAALKGLLKTVALLAGGVAALAVLSLLSSTPLETFLRLLSYAGTAMMLVSVAAMLLTFRQARTLEPVALLLSLAVSLVSTLLGLALAAMLPPGLLLLGGFAAGGGAGALWARTTLLFVEGDTVRGRGTLWSLAIWAASFALSQVVTATAGTSGTASAVVMMASAGLAAGNTLALALRVRRLRATLAPA